RPGLLRGRVLRRDRDHRRGAAQRGALRRRRRRHRVPGHARPQRHHPPGEQRAPVEQAVLLQRRGLLRRPLTAERPRPGPAAATGPGHFSGTNRWWEEPENPTWDQTTGRVLCDDPRVSGGPMSYPDQPNQPPQWGQQPPGQPTGPGHPPLGQPQPVGQPPAAPSGQPMGQPAGPPMGPPPGQPMGQPMGPGGPGFPPPGQPVYGGPGGPPPRKKPVWMIPLSIVLAVALVGGGVWASVALVNNLFGGPQPESVLPGSSLAFAKVDLKPSGGQWASYAQFYERLPDTVKDDLGGS